MKNPYRKIAHIDPFCGASGDMFLGAFVDLGFPVQRLEEVVAGLQIPGCSIHCEKIKKKGISAAKLNVIVEEMKRPHAHLKDVVRIIDSSAATGGAKEWAKKIFRRIAEAEALVHGTTPEKIHFHEVGAVDSIVDILGAAMALDYFQFDEIICAPVNTGSGTVQCDHGILPVPAPAVAELLKGIPSFSSGIPRELTTPTGAAIIVAAATSFGPLPLMKVEGIGYGAGTADLESTPNVLRILVGQGEESPEEETLTELEANIDDMNPEGYEYVMEKLFQAGALDVFLTPIIMKKSRPAVKMSVLCEEERTNEIQHILFLETTTFGVRRREVKRRRLERSIETVETSHGPVEVKIGSFKDHQILQVSPEYESCAAIARESGVPFREVFDAAREAWKKKHVLNG